jgi:DNA-binding SARP family transcriptional activator
MHPLLRDFLATRLKHRFGDDEVREMHRAVAIALGASDPLLASRHFMNAGDRIEAMNSLESSILKTIGSGRWGLAVELVDALRDVRPGPGVAAIRARKLMDDGDLAAAERILDSVSETAAEPSVRSALRHARLSLGWRTSRPEIIQSAVRALLIDEETPAPVREIAQLFVDTDLDGDSPSLAVLAKRLERMSETHSKHGLDFYAAVALNNASAFYLGAGDYQACLDAARKALSVFARLHLQAVEASSTHSMIAVALMEMGRDVESTLDVVASMQSGRDLADVPAVIAVAYFSTGQTDEAMRLLDRARALESQGRSDIAGSEVTAIAEAWALLAESPARAIELLDSKPSQNLFDPGQSLERLVILAHAYLAAGERSSAAEVASSGLADALRRGAHRSELRFALILGLATEDRNMVAGAARRAAVESRLALSELADVLCERLDICELCLDDIGTAIDAHPRRWLPLLRQALGSGAPSGDQAARLIDSHGEARDVALLRAYSRTYRVRGASSRLGDALSLRTSPRLRIHDLGRVIIEIGERTVSLAGIRRKPAALLMYLVSRPAFTAHRDQILDDLWPDADPASAINSLNQSLYFLRREIDPWYEDGQSTDYIGFAGDLVWLNADLVTSDSAAFASTIQKWRHGSSSEILDGLRGYSGHFAPEFEYEEWALSFRSKLKSKFLETATSSISRLIRTRDLEGARAVALLALEADDAASDIERALIWLHWRLGARSAARAQFEHLVRLDERDGLEPAPLVELVEGPAPLNAQ